MSVHIEDLASAVYFYAPGDSYEAGSEPAAVGSLARKEHGEVEVLSTKGELSLPNLRELVRQLTDRGVHRLHIKRRKGHRVPMGKLVKSEKAFDYYVVDLA